MEKGWFGSGRPERHLWTTSPTKAKARLTWGYLYREVVTVAPTTPSHAFTVLRAREAQRDGENKGRAAALPAWKAERRRTKESCSHTKEGAVDVVRKKKRSGHPGCNKHPSYIRCGR